MLFIEVIEYYTSLIKYSYIQISLTSNFDLIIKKNIFLLIAENSCLFNQILSEKEYVALGFGIVAIILFEIK